MQKVKAGRVVQRRKTAQSAVDAAIKSEARHLRWEQYIFEAPSSVVFWLRYNQHRPGLRFVDLDPQRLIQVAARYRITGGSPADALLEMTITEHEDVLAAARALVLSGICKSTRE